MANLIANVETAWTSSGTTWRSGATTRKTRRSLPRHRATRRGRKATDTEKSKASIKKDALDDALGDLNRSTNRLRKFDPTDEWMETKGEVETVADDGRTINQVVARGSYGPEAARLWAVLRTGINDLARAYGMPRLGV